jgi:cysteine desulfurase/selenocysteine lyase
MAMLGVDRIREDFPVLSRTVHGRPLVDLDNAATSQKPRAMIERITQIYAHDYARAEEGHTLSREATEAFEGTPAKVTRLINAAEPREIVFCRGATEALYIVTRIVQHMGSGPTTRSCSARPSTTPTSCPGSSSVVRPAHACGSCP